MWAGQSEFWDGRQGWEAWLLGLSGLPSLQILQIGILLLNTFFLSDRKNALGFPVTPLAPVVFILVAGDSKNETCSKKPGGCALHGSDTWRCVQARVNLNGTRVLNLPRSFFHSE